MHTLNLLKMLLTATITACSCKATVPTAFPKSLAWYHQRLQPNVFHFRAFQHVPRAIPHPATEVPRLNARLDDELSNRFLELDPAGYFIIKLDRQDNVIFAEWFTNTINKNGLACDPVTGEVIPCTAGYVRPPSKVFRGRNAKEISIAILEAGEDPVPVTRLEHANYLGREFQRAEMALITGGAYIQD